MRELGGGDVYKSTDSGESWSPANTGLIIDTSPVLLVIDPSNPATLYAGTGGGVFKSTDGGASWSPANNGLNSAYVTTLTIDPSKPATLYAGSDRGVYKTTDSGESWSPASNGLTGYVLTLTIDPSNPATIYAGTWGHGMYKSTNSGRIWNPANTNGMLNTDTDVGILTIDPSNPATLYAIHRGMIIKFTSAYECLFVWAEKNYSSFFAQVGSPSAVWDTYIYRHYLATNAYLGVSSVDNHVYYMGPDGALQDEGPLSDWLPKAGCPAPATPPTECLFNWAESGYPSLFNPAGAPTEVLGIYTYRHYWYTNIYVGVSSFDNHVYYMGPDGVLQDEGLLSNWLFLASCL